nr:hypothetical protein [Halalkalicoccus subterraneus]
MGDDTALFTSSDGHREPKLAETSLLVWTVLQWFPVLRRVTPWRIDDLLKLVQNMILFVSRECLEIDSGL